MRYWLGIDDAKRLEIPNEVKRSLNREKYTGWTCFARIHTFMGPVIGSLGIEATAYNWWLADPTLQRQVVIAAIHHTDKNGCPHGWKHISAHELSLDNMASFPKETQDALWALAAKPEPLLRGVYQVFYGYFPPFELYDESLRQILPIKSDRVITQGTPESGINIYIYSSDLTTVLAKYKLLAQYGFKNRTEQNEWLTSKAKGQIIDRLEKRRIL